MRCPKCHYISFDNGERCRNCGYEFSLAVDAQSIDLPIQTGDEAAGPLADLELSSHTPAPEHTAAASAAARRSAGASAFDLPLFSEADANDDRPLVTPSAVPRPPLAVRRGSPAIARRTRAVPEPEEPALALEEPGEESEPHVAMPPRAEAAAAVAASPFAIAPVGRRILGGLIDAAIILGIDTAIIYFTLQLCALRLDEITIIPPVPFLTFVLLLNGGYFAGFVAAGGQTIGKMAAGIRVVPAAGGGARVSFGYAVLRAAAYLVSVLPAGLGLLPALFSPDRRTLHDRLADTRVVRSSGPVRE